MLPQLPGLTGEIREVELTRAQKKMYDVVKKKLGSSASAQLDLDDLVDDPLFATSTAASVVKLRQIVADPAILDPTLIDESAKTELLLEMMSDYPDEKMVAFTWYRKHAELIADAVQRRTGSRARFYHGGQSQEENDSTLSKWAHDDKCRVLVGTIGSMGEGLNLQKAAHIVVFMDRHYNAEKNGQARDRLWRMGQEYPVHRIDVLAPGTTDDHLTDIIEKKLTITSEAMAIAEMAKRLVAETKGSKKDA
jgi:SNF2 family DNA or RNA helicase